MYRGIYGSNEPNQNRVDMLYLASPHREAKQN